MQIIHVPAPSKQAFNKGRRISDLIRAQIGHLKHIEHQLSDDQRQQLLAQVPQHPITTEEEAARYIGPMTAFLRARLSAPAAPSPLAAADTAPPPKTVRRKSAARKSAAKKKGGKR